MMLARPLTLCRHLYETSRSEKKQIRLFDWLGSQLLERDTSFIGNGGRRFPAVISAPIDLKGRPNYFRTGADEQELANPILSLCHGIFTD